VITGGVTGIAAVLGEASSTTWPIGDLGTVPVRGQPRIGQIPAYIRAVRGFKHHYSHISNPTTAFHTIHIMVDEDLGGHVGGFAERYTLCREQAAFRPPARRRRATRRCWDLRRRFWEGAEVLTRLTRRSSCGGRVAA
jgi:hypothetical protein